MIKVKDKAKGKRKKSGKIISLKTKSKRKNSFLRTRWHDLVLIALIGFLAYVPVLNNEFVGFDDKALIVENPVIAEEGFNAALSWGMRSPYYKPVVFLSWKIENALFGFNPMVFHFNNLLIHLFNTLLLYFIVIAWSKFWDFTYQHRYQFAFLTALLFAIHPMHVESVAWAVERKDVLFSAFFLTGLWSYMKFSEDNKMYWIAITAACYLASMLCKAPGIMLIAVLFCYDFLARKPLNANLLIPKIPVFAICLLGLYFYGLFSHFEIHTSGVTAGLEGGNVDSRASANSGTGNYLTGILMMNFKMLFWFFHTLLPLKLSIAYPRNGFVENYGSLIMVLPLLSGALAFLGWKSLKSNRLLVFAGLFFLATLLPALVRSDYGIGIFISDRYSYLPSIGVIMGMVVFMIWLQERLFQSIKNFSLFTCGSIALFYFIGTFTMTQVWKNSETLWTNTIEKYPSVSYAYANRSKYYLDNGQNNKALADLNNAVNLDPENDPYLVERARAYRQLKQYDLAAKDLEKALKINPKNISAHLNRGNVLHDLQQFEKALQDFNFVLDREPDHLNALTNRASIHGQFGRYELALKDVNHALNLSPNYPNALNNKIFIHYSTGAFEQSIQACNQFLQVKPNDHEIYHVRGTLFDQLNKPSEAINDFTKAIFLNPNDFLYYEARAGVYQKMGKIDLAQQDAQKAARLKG